MIALIPNPPHRKKKGYKPRKRSTPKSRRARRFVHRRVKRVKRIRRGVCKASIKRVKTACARRLMHAKEQTRNLIGKLTSGSRAGERVARVQRVADKSTRMRLASLFAVPGRLVTENPGVLSSVTRGFRADSLTIAGSMAAGAFGNAWIVNQVTSRWFPNWSTGWRRSIVGTLSAGALGIAASKVKPNVAASVFAGALAETIISWAAPVVSGYLTATPPAPPAPPPEPPPINTVPAANEAAPMAGMDEDNDVLEESL